MNNHYVSYPNAISLKRLGFNEPCTFYYHIYDDIQDCIESLESTCDMLPHFLNSLNRWRCAAPLLSDVCVWLWDNYHILVKTVPCDKGFRYHILEQQDDGEWHAFGIVSHTLYNDLYKMLDAAITSAIELIDNDVIKQTIENETGI